LHHAYSRCLQPPLLSKQVCNKDTGFECVACEPELICYDSEVNKGTCCNNFDYLIEFTKSVISALAAISVESSFSIVPFATNAELVGNLASAEEALDSLDALTFAGGRTNHAAAIDLCRASLQSSPVGDRKNYLLLITDGRASEPGGLPGLVAEAAATEAKSEGIFIITVMIKQWLHAYLERISSDGVVFDASDFDVLDSLKERLLAQVSCQL
jgi:hypothetical protein